MRAPLRSPCVLAIGGLDPGGGAGILADARAIMAGGAFACAVIAVSTVQSTRGLRSAHPAFARTWIAQARIVISDQHVRAMKLGALGSAANVRAAAKLISSHRDIPVVVDPVMIPTRGHARLLSSSALTAMKNELVPRATLVTANAAEAEALTGARVTSVAEARTAARALVAMGARAALVKGGHLAGPRAIDVLAIGDRIIELSRPRLRLRRGVHGTGCVLASLVAARLACGEDVLAAVRFAKRLHHVALGRAVSVGDDLDVLVF